MAKKTSKWIKTILIVAGIVLTIPASLFFIVQIPAVQTIIVHRLTDNLSSKLKSEISIGEVNYRFFNKLALTEILFLDNNRDTLLYTSKVTVGIRKLGLRDGTLLFGRINLEKPIFNIITDSAGASNLNSVLENLRSEPYTSSNKPFLLSIDRIDLEDACFSLVNKTDTGLTPVNKVDFGNLELKSINGSVENFSINDDTISLDIFNLELRERSGFKISELNSSLEIYGSNILLESTLIKTDSSILSFEKLGIHADSSFSNFVSEVRLNIISKNTLINSNDLRYFVPVPDEVNERLTLSGKFTGTLSELRGRDIELEYGEYTKLLCDFDISGLPAIQDAFIYIGVTNFNTNVKDIENLKIGKKLSPLPLALTRLGTISFNGSFSGFITDFVTYGDFRTSVGNISTDISLRPDKTKLYTIQGLVNGININLGEILDSKTLGQVSMHANIDGKASSLKSFAGSVTGRIDSLDFNNYNYRNINLKGNFTEDTWNGSINVNDNNIELDLLGLFNFTDTLPEFDFTLDLAKMDMYKLNIDKKDSTASLSLNMTSNFRGNNFDNLDGEIKLLTSTITRKGKTLDLNDFTLQTFKEQNIPVLSLKTDFLDAEIKGRYNFKGLTQTITTAISSAMPSLVKATPEKDLNIQNDFKFAVNFKNTDELNEFFETGLTLAEDSYIKGSIVLDTILNIEGLADFVLFRNIRANELSINTNYYKAGILSAIKTSSLELPGSTILKNFSLVANTEPDTLILSTNWDNKEPVLNKGLLLTRGILSRDSITGNKVLKIDIDSSEVYANNSLWKISQSEVVLGSGSVSINDVRVASTGRFYQANGTLSHNSADTMYLAFKGIDIEPLNHFGKKEVETDVETDTSKLMMNIKGRLNGTLALTNIFESPLLESDITINDFSILGSQYGDIYIKSGYDYTSKVVDIAASNNLGGIRVFDLDGYYDPDLKNLSVDVIASKLPVEALNPLLRSFASDITGSVTGKLNLSAKSSDLVLKGAVKAENVNIRIDFLNTLYTINDSIKFDKQGIKFNNMKFSDNEGHSATLDGTVFHKSFNDFSTDLIINMGNNFKVLNTQLKDNSSFYGTAYASGVVSINIEPELMSFDISATTGRNTRFSIPLSDEQSVSEYPFINFINPNEEKKASSLMLPAEPEKQVGFDINIDLNVTPDAVTELIFDEKAGNKITGTGSGILNISLNPAGDFMITGDYTIEKGDYLFTPTNIINKKFEVENGGKISFNGDLDNAEIELKAIYQKFNASLAPILHDEERTERVSVEPQIVLTGKLFNPNVKLDINLPDADEETKTYLSNAISTDEELFMQFLSLLMLRRFYSDQSSLVSSSSSGTNMMASTTLEMFFNQFSNWISNDNLNLGINYKPGDESNLNPDEVQLAFEKKFLDDRVIINGNFDYSSTTGGATEKLTGDFEAEVKVKKMKFKVFNRFNDISMGKGYYTQGVGIFFGREFEKISDLFKKRQKKEAKKEEEVSIKDK
ncbi:MAG TPA: translocation/assembly module TamB domain-containing protein [Bacteroidales bacterium]|nr:translocation/assembly module TamB domain-containing protein [Bacteroidales bacterium]